MTEMVPEIPGNKPTKPMKTNLQLRRTSGFTLVEMLVTITIIVILAGLSLGGFKFVASKQANEQARIQIKLLERGLEEYKLDNGKYPPSNSGSNPIYVALYEDGVNRPDENKIYVPELDPNNNKQGWSQGTTIVDPWGQQYVYRSPGTINPDFDLLSKGPDNQTSTNLSDKKTRDDITNY